MELESNVLVKNPKIQLSHEKKTSHFPLYCLVNRDPYNGSLYTLYTWVVSSPIYPKQPRFFFMAQLGPHDLSGGPCGGDSYLSGRGGTSSIFFLWGAVFFYEKQNLLGCPRKLVNG